MLKIVNAHTLAEESWASPKGKFCGAGKEISEALGRKPQSTDLNDRHPFDVEIIRIPPGKTAYPYHLHSRHKDGKSPVGPGDAFLFKPDEPHQIINDGTQDFILYVVADNPFGESVYYPDSNKWGVRSPERRLLRSEGLEYYDGEE